MPSHKQVSLTFAASKLACRKLLKSTHAPSTILARHSVFCTRSLGSGRITQYDTNFGQSRSFQISACRQFSTGMPCWDEQTSAAVAHSLSYTPPPSPPLRGYTLLSTRSLIAVGGPESAKFLNGIVSNKVVEPDDESFDDTYAQYCSFLNSKGRMIAESFIYPIHSTESIQKLVDPLLPEIPGLKEASPAEYLIDCDKDIASQLFTTLKLYKLRSKVSLARVPEDVLRQWAVWDDSPVGEELSFYTPRNLSLFSPEADSVGYASFPDVRAPGIGLRLILPGPDATPENVFSLEVRRADPPLQHASLVSYDIRRLLYGIPEGIKELPPGKALPLENCIDFMNGIHFNKGCYVGQELTVRSHHHGVVRKRVIPVVFSSPNSDSTGGQDLNYDPESLVAKMDTTKLLTGQDIIDERVREEPVSSSGAGESPFSAPSPFGTSSSSSVRRRRPNSKKKAVGTVISAIGNVGLALVRLEEFGNPEALPVIEAEAESEVGLKEKVVISGFQPFWWPEGPSE